MAYYLLIRGGSAANVVDALAAAADIAAHEGDYADLAVPEEFAEVARLGANIGRVIPVAPLAKPDLTAMNESGGGWRDKLKATAKNVASAAAQNIGEYKQLTKLLRDNHYDVTFDFDGTPFGVAVARAAKSEKAVGFSPESFDSPMPGLNLAYHDTRTVRNQLCGTERCRTLIARYLNRAMMPTEWKLNIAPAESRAGVLVGDSIPQPFMEVLQKAAGARDIVEANANAANAAELAEQAAKCEFAVGNGLTTALATALGAKVFFVGGAKDAPEKAIVAETPSALTQELNNWLTDDPFTPPPPQQQQNESAPPETKTETATATQQPPQTNNGGGASGTKLKLK